MKRQKKYVNEAMVIKDIDAANRRVIRLKKKAESHEATAELLRMADDTTNDEKIKRELQEADRLRDQAVRLENTRLVKLKNTLAAFRTETLPIFGDRQVVLQQK